MMEPVQSTARSQAHGSELICWCLQKSLALPLAIELPSAKAVRELLTGTPFAFPPQKISLRAVVSLQGQTLHESPGSFRAEEQALLIAGSI